MGIIGLRHTFTGDTLSTAQEPVVLEAIQFPETVISMAIEPESSTERKKLADTLELMKRQDPTFRSLENAETVPEALLAIADAAPKLTDTIGGDRAEAAIAVDQRPTEHRVG